MAGLPPNVKTLIQAEDATSHTQHLTEMKAARGITNSIVRNSAAKQFDELGPAEARSIDKALRLPT